MKNLLQGCVEGMENVTMKDEGDIRLYATTEDAPLQNQAMEEILWELTELNFRFELTALDSRLSGADVADRRRLIGECFPDCVEGKSFLLPNVEYADFGLGSLHWEQRAKHVQALKRVMVTWKCSLEPLIKEETIRWTLPIVEELERQVARCYTQAFFDHFGRAATIPRRLFNPSRRATGLVTRPDEPRVRDPAGLVYYDLSQFRNLIS